MQIYFCFMTMKRLVLLFTIAVVALWASGCRPAADEPAGGGLTGEAAQGAAIFEARCQRCHAVDGVGGSKGPDLSRISSIRDADWLRRFLENPRSVEPETKMPQVFLRPEELTAVVKYMQTLD